MYTEEKLRRVNKVIKDMVFTYEGQLIVGLDWKAKFDYQFQIKGVRQMISVGELYDYLMVDVTIIDGDMRFSVLHKLSDSLSIKDYRLWTGLINTISDELLYFFNGDYVRIHIPKDGVRISDEYNEKIDNFNYEKE